MKLKSRIHTILDQWTHTNLIFRILIGIVIGALLGTFCPKMPVINYLGVLFVGALKAIAPILVFVLVVSSISKAGKGIGRKFRNVIVLYM